MSTANKVKGKYRFNVIDILLLVVIAVSIGALLFLYLYDGQPENNDDKVKTVEIIYTVEQKEIPEILRGKINVGDSVTEAESLTNVGHVINVEYTDSVYSGYNSESNTTFEELYPGKIDLKVRISANAVVDEKGMYVVNGCVLNAGKELELRFPYYTGNTVCVLVSEVRT